MSNSNEAQRDTSPEEQPSSGDDPERGGHSGEGAASALAHLKTQSRQQRRQVGDSEEKTGGSGQ
jgi:hypothetical protein